MKSCFWNGSSSARAAFRPASSSARIILRMATMRWSPKNMCSVRHSPIPSAPNSRALAESLGVSALVRTLRVRTLSAHFISVKYSSGMIGSTVGISADPDLAGRAVDREVVAGLDGLALDRERAGLLVDFDRLATDDARLSPAPGDDGRVARLATGRRQDALGQVHAGDVLGAGLFPHEHESDLGVLGSFGDGFGGREHHLAHRRARAGGDPLSDRLVRLPVLGIDLRHQQMVQTLGTDPLDRRLFVDLPFLHQLDGDPHRRGARPLAGARLQHVELAGLHGELDVLHFLVVRLQLLADLEQLLVDLGHLVHRAG